MRAALVLIFLCLVALNAALEGGDLKGLDFFNCTGKNGYFADRYRGCHVFYRCIPDGTKWTFSCALDMLFSDPVQTCLEPEKVYCPAPEY